MLMPLFRIAEAFAAEFEDDAAIFRLQRVVVAVFVHAVFQKSWGNGCFRDYTSVHTQRRKEIRVQQIPLLRAGQNGATP